MDANWPKAARWLCAYPVIAQNPNGKLLIGQQSSALTSSHRFTIRAPLNNAEPEENMQFTIDPGKNSEFAKINASFTVSAKTHEEAAQKAVRKLFGSKRGLTAVRTTGNTGMSGMFNAYLPCKTGGQSSHGYNFHVRQLR